MRMKIRSLPLVTLSSLIVLAAQGLFAQAGPLSGSEATVTLVPAATTLAPNASVSVPVRIDLTGISGKNAAGILTPAVLGGYQIEITFDNTRLRLDEVSGGTSTSFTSAPTFTKLDKANTTGRVAIVAAQAAQNGPSGLVHISTLRFTARGTGAANISATPTSLATAMLGGAGPVAIPATGSVATLNVGTSTRSRAVGK